MQFRHERGAGGLGSPACVACVYANAEYEPLLIERAKGGTLYDTAAGYRMV